MQQLQQHKLDTNKDIFDRFLSPTCEAPLLLSAAAKEAARAQIVSANRIRTLSSPPGPVSSPPSLKPEPGVGVGVGAKMSKIVEEDECPSPTSTKQNLIVKPVSQVRVHA